jgi:hypothetical protein
MNKLEEEMHQLGYGLKLSKLTDLQHEEAAARRADWARIDKRNSPEALRKAIYDTPPYDTPYMSEILRSKGE